VFAFLYRMLLRSCPADIRAAQGAEMEEIARWLASSRPSHTRLLAYGRSLCDLIVYAMAERRHRRGLPLRNRRPRVWKLNQDLRSALRQMKARPAFSAAIIGMLSLGIGASAAIFSVLYGVLLKPLPFPKSDRIVEVSGALPARDLSQIALSEANAWDLIDMNQSFEEMGAYHGRSFSLTGDGAPERVRGAAVTVGFLRTLGVVPVAGRLFSPGEDATGAPADRALISERLWARRFGGDRSLVGKSIMLNGRSHEVVGVLPRGPVWFDRNDVFIPFVRRAKVNRASWEYSVIGRLKPGVSHEAAQADLKRLARLLEHHPDNKGWDLVAARSDTWIASDDLRRMLWVMLWSVLALLVIASVNVTNLLMVQASTRSRERAMRTALGATRGDLVRAGLTESMLLSGLGMALGVAVAFGLLNVFKAADPGGIPRLADAGLNGWVLAFTIAVAAIVGLVTGLVPAMQSSFGNIVTALRQGQRGSIGDRRSDRTRGMFVTVEVALSVLLVIGAGLLVRSLTNVLASERGFTTERRLLATVSIPGAYPDGKREEIAGRILENVAALPDVISVGGTSGSPLSDGSTGMGFDAKDRPMGDAAPWASWRLVTKDYLTTMGLRIVDGRGLTEEDIIGKPWRVVISERLARQMWPGQSAVGRTAILWKGQGQDEAEVVGVVSDMRERGLEEDPTFAVYIPAYGAMNATTLPLVIQTRGNPMDVVPSLRDAVHRIDASLPISDVRSLEEVVNRSVATRRFTMFLLATFAGLALLLALAGVGGVLAYSMARRTGEMGVRLALGARHSGLVALAMRQGLTPVVIGLVIGIGVTFWLSRLMASLLFGVTARDPITYAVAVVSLLVAAAIACYVPARKALRVDPAQALRSE
jgi:putative ABC transport system permease protein